jgi:hypothetical protein
MPYSKMVKAQKEDEVTSLILNVSDISQLVIKDWESLIK